MGRNKSRVATKEDLTKKGVGCKIRTKPKKQHTYLVEGEFSYKDKGVLTTEVIARLKKILKQAGMFDRAFEIRACIVEDENEALKVIE